MKKLHLLSILFLLPVLINAQNEFPLESSGTIPSEITTPSSKKYGNLLKKSVKQTSKAAKKKDNDIKVFNVQSHFSIDQVLKSGRVLFNDPIGNYVNQVLKQIINANPEFKKPAQVYVLRSRAVNAFATDRGTIFVTLGLLSQLENEAQLAYILAHEMVHVEKRHALDLFIESKSIDRIKVKEKNQYKDFTIDDKLLRKNQYSQGLEKEADAEGLNYFLKTGYTTKELDQVFDVLRYSYLPFDLIPLDSTYFNDAYYQLPGFIWEFPLQPIAAREDDKDSTSTHPGSEERRALLLKSLETQDKKEGVAFLVSETEFNRVRNLARQELPELYLHAGNFPDAAYHAYLLQKTGAPNVRADKALLKALYLHAKVKNEESFNERIPAVKEIQGEPQRMHYLMDTLSAKELTVFALKYGWKIQSLYKEDQEIKTIVKDLFTELSRHVQSLDEFRRVNPTEVRKEPVAPVEQPKKNNKKGKLAKIKEQSKQKKPSPLEDPHAYWRGAFVEEKNDTSFNRYFKEGLATWTKRKEWNEWSKSSAGINKLYKEARRKEKKGHELGIKKFVIVNPTYYRINENGKVDEALLQTEVGQHSLYDVIKEVGKLGKMEQKILDVHHLKPEQTEEFNELRYLNDWFAEQIQYGNLSITPGVNQAKIDAIARKYGTDYFMWTGVISSKGKESALGPIALSLYGTVFAPAIAIRYLEIRHSTYVFAMVCNVKTGQMTLVKDQGFYGLDNDEILKKHYYDILNQVVTKPKKK